MHLRAVIDVQKSSDDIELEDFSNTLFSIATGVIHRSRGLLLRETVGFQIAEEILDGYADAVDAALLLITHPKLGLDVESQFRLALRWTTG